MSNIDKSIADNSKTPELATKEMLRLHDKIIGAQSELRQAKFDLELQERANTRLAGERDRIRERAFEAEASLRKAEAEIERLKGEHSNCVAQISDYARRSQDDIEHWQAKLREREAALAVVTDALKELVALKDIKEGRTENGTMREYMTRRPEAWDAARAALSHPAIAAAAKLREAEAKVIEAANVFWSKHSSSHTMEFRQCDGCDLGNAVAALEAARKESK